MKFIRIFLFVYLVVCQSACSAKSLGLTCSQLVIDKDYQEALVVCERAYNEALWKLGENHPETLVSQIGLLDTYLYFDRYNNDAELLARTLEDRTTKMLNTTDHKLDIEKVSQSVTQTKIFSLTSLAAIHERQGKLSQSIEDWKSLYIWTKKFPESQFVSEQFFSSIAIADLCLDERRLDESKYYLNIADDLYTRYSGTELLNDDDDIKDYHKVKARSKDILEHNK